MAEKMDGNIIKSGKNKNELRKEVLEHLQRLAGDGWKIFAFYHMNMDKRRWLKEPHDLAGYGHYEIIKSWLQGNMVSPHKSTLDGLIKYKNGEADATPTVESIYFNLWLMKDDEVCIISYGEHKFDNKDFDKALGGITYSLIVTKWHEMILPALAVLSTKNNGK